MNIGAAFTLIRNGASIKQTDSAGGIPITRIETIANRVIDRNHMGYADIYNGDKYSSYFLRDGDILMSHINSIQHLGKAAIYHPLDEKEKIIHGMNLLVLRANQKILDNQFAYFYFSSDSFLHKLPRITKKSVNQASFTVSELKKIDIPCPALSQQHKIAKILSIIQTLCNKRNEQLKIFDELVKSRFLEMFGNKEYSICQLSDQCEIITKGTTPTTIGYNFTTDGVRFIKIENITEEGKFDTAKMMHISDECNMIMKRSQLKSGDLLFSIAGAIGRCAVVTNDILPANINQALAIIRLRKDAQLSRNFLFAVLKSSYVEKQYKGLRRGGAQLNLSLKDIGNFKILLPPESEQENFIDLYKQVDKSKMAVQKSLDELEILKKSLMQTYFG